jgi:hypothetical protein
MTPWHKELQSFANNLQTYTVYMAHCAATSRSTSEKRFRALAIYLLLKGVEKGGEDALSGEFSWYNSVIRRTEIEAVRHCMIAGATIDPFSFVEVKRTCQGASGSLEGFDGLSTQRKNGRQASSYRAN